MKNLNDIKCEESKKVGDDKFKNVREELEAELDASEDREQCLLNMIDEVYGEK